MIETGSMQMDNYSRKSVLQRRFSENVPECYCSSHVSIDLNRNIESKQLLLKYVQIPSIRDYPLKMRWSQVRSRMLCLSKDGKAAEKWNDNCNSEGGAVMHSDRLLTVTADPSAARKITCNCRYFWY